ncbi:unnamed protein product [Closterium sp. NIES-65]|nr:unnamed protein product [Closterium sp. NIES-65]
MREASGARDGPADCAEDTRGAAGPRTSDGWFKRSALVGTGEGDWGGDIAEDGEGGGAQVNCGESREGSDEAGQVEEGRQTDRKKEVRRCSRKREVEKLLLPGLLAQSPPTRRRRSVAVSADAASGAAVATGKGRGIGPLEGDGNGEGIGKEIAREAGSGGETCNGPEDGAGAGTRRGKGREGVTEGVEEGGGVLGQAVASAPGASMVGGTGAESGAEAVPRAAAAAAGTAGKGGAAAGSSGRGPARVTAGAGGIGRAAAAGGPTEGSREESAKEARGIAERTGRTENGGRRGNADARGAKRGTRQGLDRGANAAASAGPNVGVRTWANGRPRDEGKATSREGEVGEGAATEGRGARAAKRELGRRVTGEAKGKRVVGGRGRGVLYSKSPTSSGRAVEVETEGGGRGEEHIRKIGRIACQEKGEGGVRESASEEFWGCEADCASVDAHEYEVECEEEEACGVMGEAWGGEEGRGRGEGVRKTPFAGGQRGRVSDGGRREKGVEDGGAARAVWRADGKCGGGSKRKQAELGMGGAEGVGWGVGSRDEEAGYGVGGVGFVMGVKPPRAVGAGIGVVVSHLLYLVKPHLHRLPSTVFSLIGHVGYAGIL